MNFSHLLKKVFGKYKTAVSKAKAISIAKDECRKHKWDWRGPVKVQSGRGWWIVLTNWGYRGANVRIVIDQETGEIVESTYLPR